MTRTVGSDKRVEMPMAAIALMRVFVELAAKAAVEGKTPPRPVECTVTATYEDDDGFTREVTCGVSSEAKELHPVWWGASDGMQEGARG